MQRISLHIFSSVLILATIIYAHSLPQKRTEPFRQTTTYTLAPTFQANTIIPVTALIRATIQAVNATPVPPANEKIIKRNQQKNSQPQNLEKYRKAYNEDIYRVIDTGLDRKVIDRDLEIEIRGLTLLLNKEEPEEVLKKAINKTAKNAETYLEKFMQAPPPAAFDTTMLKFLSCCVLLSQWHNSPQLFDDSGKEFLFLLDSIKQQAQIDTNMEGSASNLHYGFKLIQDLRESRHPENNAALMVIIAHEQSHVIANYMLRFHRKQGNALSIDILQELFAILSAKYFEDVRGLPAITDKLYTQSGILQKLKGKNWLYNEHQSATAIIQHLVGLGYSHEELMTAFYKVFRKQRDLNFTSNPHAPETFSLELFKQTIALLQSA